MNGFRAALVIAAAALASAALLGLVSRTPASIRHVEPEPNATDPSLGAHFSDEEVARHGAYRGPAYLFFALSTFVEVVILVVLARGPLPRIASHLPESWVLRALVLGALVTAVLAAGALPLAYVRGYAIEHAWGLSTQDAGGWLADRARSLGVAAVIASISAIAFFGIVRWQPKTWWLWGWAAFTALTALLVFLWPIVIAPLFNKFTPLQDPALETRIRALATEADVDIDEVEVADASRRTTAENAYVAGLGGTKKLVLYDTLLRAGDDDETAFVVAHELGHRAEGHVWKTIVIASAGLLAGFAALSWLSDRPGVWSWAGASGISDVRALPVLLLFATLAGLLAMPIENAVSRRFEAKADSIALELTDDPATATRVFRRLAFSNLADLRPPAPAVWLFFSHPPIPERIESAVADYQSAP